MEKNKKRREIQIETHFLKKSRVRRFAWDHYLIVCDFKKFI